MRTNDELEKLLAVFRKETLENFFTLTTYLKISNISTEELETYLKWKREQVEFKGSFRKEAEEQFAKWRKNTRRCPTCMKPLMGRPISIPKGKGNTKGYTCHWYCQEENCNFEEYTHENFQEIYKRIMEV